MIELWLIVSTMCFRCSDGFRIANLDTPYNVEQFFNKESAPYSEPFCVQYVQISTSCPTPKEGEEVKRICDYVGHEWKETYVSNRVKYWRGRECIYCRREERKVEKIEYIEVK